MTKNAIKDIIFNANKAWNHLYFDGFLDREDFQITWLEGADRPYYNCIHVHEFLNPETLKMAEDFFHRRSEPPRIYTHTNTDREFIRTLRSLNYRELAEEEEIWYEFPVRERKDTLHLPDLFRGNFENLAFKSLRSDPDEIAEFMDLNSTCNAIPPELSKKFQAKILESMQDSHANLQCFSIHMDQTIATIGTMSCIKNMAFLSEGATGEQFQRMGLYSTLVAYRLNLSRTYKSDYAYIRCDRDAWSNRGCLKLGFNKIFTRRLWEKEQL